jgi:hypothetical protein
MHTAAHVPSGGSSWLSAARLPSCHMMQINLRSKHVQLSVSLKLAQPINDHFSGNVCMFFNKAFLPVIWSDRLAYNSL